MASATAATSEVVFINSRATKRANEDDWHPIVPVPESTHSAIPRHKHGKPSASWEYRDAEGRLLGLTVRFDLGDGEKEVLPLTPHEGPDGDRAWRWKGFPDPRPLYGLDRLAARPDAPVIVTEGEKTADAAASLFPDHVAITSPGGCKAATMADWAPLKGRRVVIWPDHDAAGAGYGAAVTKAAMQAGVASVAVVQVPDGFPPKWDVADTLPDGWDAIKLRALLDGASPVNSTEGGRGVGTLPLKWLHEIDAVTDTIDFVEDLLGIGQMSVLYGESNTGKTFLACDLALHVALGREWGDRQVDGGGVIYVALEGGHGIQNRLSAFKVHSGLENATEAPLALIASPVNLCDPDADTAALIATIQAAANKIGVPVRLIIIDTLSRAMAGGNENSSEDMGALVANADRIRQETGAHLMFVHHSGKDTSKGARGHSLLRAATDTEIEVTRDQVSGISTATLTKQRDLPLEGKISFRLEAVELGTNQRGKPVTSCVVVPVECAVARKPVKLSPKEKLALDQLKNCLCDHGEIHRHRRDIPHVMVVKIDRWREYLKRAAVTDRDKPDSERKQFQRINEALVNKGVIRIWDGLVWLVSHDVTKRDIPGMPRPVTVTPVTPPYKGVTAVTPGDWGGDTAADTAPGWGVDIT